MAAFFGLREIVQRVKFLRLVRRNLMDGLLKTSKN